MRTSDSQYQIGLNFYFFLESRSRERDSVLDYPQVLSS